MSNTEPLYPYAERVSWCTNFAQHLGVHDSAHETIEQKLEAIATKEPNKAKAMRDYFQVQDNVHAMRHEGACVSRKTG